jgi:hypothetical protein
MARAGIGVFLITVFCEDIHCTSFTESDFMKVSCHSGHITQRPAGALPLKLEDGFTDTSI